MPPTQKDHQIQLPAIPCLATTPQTNKGVSAAKVVATIEVPASHQETSRPDTKNSSVLPPARRRVNSDQQVDQQVANDHGPIDGSERHQSSALERGQRATLVQSGRQRQCLNVW